MQCTKCASAVACYCSPAGPSSASAQAPNPPPPPPGVPCICLVPCFVHPCTSSYYTAPGAGGTHGVLVLLCREGMPMHETKIAGNAGVPHQDATRGKATQIVHDHSIAGPAWMWRPGPPGLHVRLCLQHATPTVSTSTGPDIRSHSTTAITAAHQCLKYRPHLTWKPGHVHKRYVCSVPNPPPAMQPMYSASCHCSTTRHPKAGASAAAGTPQTLSRLCSSNCNRLCLARWPINALQFLTGPHPRPRRHLACCKLSWRPDARAAHHHASSSSWCCALPTGSHYVPNEQASSD